MRGASAGTVVPLVPPRPGTAALAAGVPTQEHGYQEVHMDAQVILGKTMFVISDADHLNVDGQLVQIQRSTPTGYQTVAVAGDDLLVTIEPAQCRKVVVEEPKEAQATNGPVWFPVGELMK